jgi:hypothetical protein
MLPLPTLVACVVVGMVACEQELAGCKSSRFSQNKKDSANPLYKCWLGLYIYYIDAEA